MKTVHETSKAFIVIFCVILRLICKSQLLSKFCAIFKFRRVGIDIFDCLYQRLRVHAKIEYVRICTHFQKLKYVYGTYNTCIPFRLAYSQKIHYCVADGEP